jgi:transcriptional regulator with XRE-family HTH domain
MTTSTDYRAIRQSTGLTLREVARRANLNPGRVSVIERGLVPTPQEDAALMAVLREALRQRMETSA